jgi:hypothetical protein
VGSRRGSRSAYHANASSMSASADGRTNTRATLNDHATQNSDFGAQLELRSKHDPRLGSRRGLQDVREGSQDANLEQPPARGRQRSRPTRTLRIRSFRRPRACRNREVDSELAEPQPYVSSTRALRQLCRRFQHQTPVHESAHNPVERRNRDWNATCSRSKTHATPRIAIRHQPRTSHDVASAVCAAVRDSTGRLQSQPTTDGREFFENCEEGLRGCAPSTPEATGRQDARWLNGFW